MRIIKNYFYNFSYQIFLIIIPIVTLPYLARILGPHNLGINTYTYSITYYFTLFAVLGTTTYAQREIAVIRDNPVKLNGFFWELETLNLITTLISFVVLSGLILVTNRYTSFMWIYSITVLASFFDVSWYFIGLEQFSVLAFRNFVIKALSVALIFMFVKNGNDLYIYILINSGSVLVSNLSLLPFLKKISLPHQKLHPFKHLRPTLLLFIPQISVSLYTVLNKILLGNLSSVSQANYFDNSDRIVRLVFTVLMSLSTVLLPAVSNKLASGKENEAKRILNLSIMFSLFISIGMFFGFFAISDSFIPLFLGPKFTEVSEVLKIQAFILIPMAIANVTGNQYLIPMKKVWTLNRSLVGGVVANLIFGFILISKFQAVGAAIAVLISELTVTIIQSFVSRDFFDFKSCLLETVKYVISGMIMCIVLTFEQNLVTGWLGIVLGIVLGIIVYILALTGLKAKIFKLLLNFSKSNV